MADRRTYTVVPRGRNPAPEQGLIADVPVHRDAPSGWKLLVVKKEGANQGREFFLCGTTDKWICWRDEWEADLSDFERGKILAKASKHLTDLSILGKKYNSQHS